MGYEDASDNNAKMIQEMEELKTQLDLTSSTLEEVQADRDSVLMDLNTAQEDYRKLFVQYSALLRKQDKTLKERSVARRQVTLQKKELAAARATTKRLQLSTSMQEDLRRLSTAIDRIEVPPRKAPPLAVWLEKEIEDANMLGDYIHDRMREVASSQKTRDECRVSVNHDTLVKANAVQADNTALKVANAALRRQNASLTRDKLNSAIKELQENNNIVVEVIRALVGTEYRDAYPPAYNAIMGRLAKLHIFGDKKGDVKE